MVGSGVWNSLKSCSRWRMLPPLPWLEYLCRVWRRHSVVRFHRESLSQLLLGSFSVTPDLTALPAKAQSSKDKKPKQMVVAAWREDSRGGCALSVHLCF